MYNAFSQTVQIYEYKTLHDIPLPENADYTLEDRDEYKVTGIPNDKCHDKERQKNGGQEKLGKASQRSEN